MTNIEILNKYTAGEITLEEANEKLVGIKLNPGKNTITAEEKRSTTIGEYPDMANGWGLLDCGAGPMDKVHVVNGKTAHPVNSVDDKGNIIGEAYVHIAGRRYAVRVDTLVEI